MTLWTECPVPLNVVLMREYMSDGERSEWGLMTTLKVDDPLEIRRLYHLRSSCEEGWRQTKCYWDLTTFRAPCFSLGFAAMYARMRDSASRVNGSSKRS